MAGIAQPLGKQFAITNPDGTPTDYFIRWAQQRQIDISGGITEAQANALIKAWSAGRTVTAGVALDGGGPLNADITIDHANTAVTPNTYGDATHVPRFTVDQQGHITNVSEVAISGGGGGGYSPVTIIQTAQQRANSATTTVTFGSALTAGNTLVMLSFGPGGTAFFLPYNVTYIGGWRNAEAGGYESLSSQSIFAGMRSIQSGDGTSWSVTSSAGDNNNLIAFEVSGFKYAKLRTQRLTVSGSNFELHIPASDYGNGARYIVVEHDGTTDPSFSASAAILATYTFGGSGNHRAVVIKVDPTFSGRLVGSFSGGPTNPVWGVLDMAG